MLAGGDHDVVVDKWLSETLADFIIDTKEEAKKDESRRQKARKARRCGLTGTVQ